MGAGGGLGVALFLWKGGQASSQVCHSQGLSSPSLPHQSKSKTHKTLSSGSQQLFALLPKSAESHQRYQEPGFSQVSQVRFGHPCRLGEQELDGLIPLGPASHLPLVG